MNLEAYFKLTYGLYVVSSFSSKKINGFISNTVFQVTAEPAQITIASHKDNFTTELIDQSKLFSVSILKKDVKNDIFQVFGYKSGKDIDKFKNYKYKTGKSGVPIFLEDTVAWFECEVVQKVEVGTHMIFIGKVLENEVLDSSSEPITYAYYHEAKKGYAPKNSPTYINPDLLLKEIAKPNSNLYHCPTCSYIYEPEKGDLMGDIPPGTSFEDLPDDWICPVCGTAKKEFIKEA